MTPPSLWQRLRSARVVQVAAVYLGASWVTLQIIDTLQGLLSLPDWVGPVAVLLLLVGLLVVLATAWVQSLPQTTAAEEAGTVPTDWEVDAGDVLESLRRGRLPHLTWGRAILGGVVALSLLFGVAGLTVILRSPQSLVGPRELGAEDAASGIAVLPFHMSGDDLDVYREGMVDLMSANLDGLSDYRAVDARTVLARWNREIGETADVELERALRVAAATGARYAVVGSGVGAGPQIRLTADIYDLADGTQLGEGGQVEGAAEEVLGLVDALTVEVMRSILDATDRSSLAQSFRLASLLTGSVPALRNYLEGDALFRRARFEEAREALQRAVERDSTFALAHWRLGETYGWIEGIASEEGRRHKERAQALADRLPERERTLLTVTSAIGSNALGLREMQTLRAYLQRYPDDPDGWYLLGEAGLHSWTFTGISDDELEEALYRTVALDPTFSPYYEHALHWATAKGHAQRYDSLMSAAAEVAENPDRRERSELRWALFQGGAEERAAAVARLEEMEPAEVVRVDQSAMGLVDEELERLVPLWMHREDRDVPLVRLYGEQGRLEEMVALALESGAQGLDEAVARLSDWAWEGEVPRSLLDRLDQALGGDVPEDDPRVMLRVELDAILGRPVDEEAAGRVLDAQADVFLPELAEEMDTTGIRDALESATLASARIHQGRVDEVYRSAGPPADRGLEPPSWIVARRGWAALEVGEYAEAVQALEGISRSNERTIAKLRLGRAYEALGRDQEALDAYRIFLSRTASADEGLGAIAEARAAVARLGGG